MGAPDIDRYIERIKPIGVATLAALSAMEAAQRRLHPPAMSELRERLSPLAQSLASALASGDETDAPEALAAFHRRFVEGAERSLKSVQQFTAPAPAEEAIMRVLASFKTFSRALETLYGLVGFPPLSQYFLEEAARARFVEYAITEPAAGPSVGLQLSGGPDDPAGRGHFALYVPERYSGDRDLALVVALHGGSGTGREFVWTWLREARTRGFLLLAPTSTGPTWDLFTGDADAASLARMVEYVAAQYRVDRSKVLLTGLSDGATYTLLGGLREDSPFTHLAPLSGVFHPANEHNGNLARAKDKPIYLVHGALDWMFPIETARMAAQSLSNAGAALVYRELTDLSHTYAREENDRILTWLDPALSLDA